MRAKRRGRVSKVCQHCGAEYTVIFSNAEQSKWCSFSCKIAALGLRKRGRGKDGGPLKPTTYTKRGLRHLHKQVAEQKIGRQLSPDEVVHHIDGNKHNNAPENIEVLTRAEHTRRHWAQGDHSALVGPRTKREKRRCAVCGSEFECLVTSRKRMCSHPCRNAWLGELRRKH